jgi:hypothetical protein
MKKDEIIDMLLKAKVRIFKAPPLLSQKLKSYSARLLWAELYLHHRFPENQTNTAATSPSQFQFPLLHTTFLVTVYRQPEVSVTFPQQVTT